MLAFTLFHFVFQGQTYLLLQVSPDFLLLHSNPLDEKDIFFFFLVLVLEALVGLHKTLPTSASPAELYKFLNKY